MNGIDPRPLGPLLLDLDEGAADSELDALLASPAVGGIILYDRHDRGPRWLRTMLARLHALGRPLLVAVDQEGGRIQRLRSGFTALPSAATIGLALRAGDRTLALRAARAAGVIAGSELAAIGIDVVLAPVLDLAAGDSLVLAGRCYGDDAETVSRAAGAFAEGLRTAGLVPVFKHFPGHGGVSIDTHVAHAHDPRSWSDLDSRDLVPYRSLLAAGPAAVMTAHVTFSAVDDRPASLSPVWNRRILREQLGFTGPIVCDDIAMAALAPWGDLLTRARLALAAGADFVIATHLAAEERQRLVEGIHDQDPSAAERRRRLLGRGLPCSLTALRSRAEWRSARRVLGRLESRFVATDPGP